MFKRPHHQRIAQILQTFDASFLQDAECYFGGGTAITLALGEYRESVDIDFLCASTDGYRKLRNAVSSDLGLLLSTPIKHLREVRTNQYKIYTVLEVEGTPVKVEIVREARVTLAGVLDPAVGVPVLSREDMYCQKLLANDDRGLDTSVMSRDIIDLAMMIQGWGSVPSSAWDKAYRVYGDRLTRSFHSAVGMIADHRYLAGCLRNMQMDADLAGPILRTLEQAAFRLPISPSDVIERDRRIGNIASLQKGAGAEYTFWRLANAGMIEAASPAEVDWSAIERKTIEQSIGENRQSPQDVIEVVIRHSPGAVAKDRQSVIVRNADRFVEEWESWNDLSTNDDSTTGFVPK